MCVIVENIALNEMQFQEQYHITLSYLTSCD